MSNSFLFLYIIFALSIIILVIAGIVVAAFVIPLQYKESKVKNGLATLRKHMLIKGLLAETVILLAIFCLIARFIIPNADILRYLITGMILVFSLGLLGKALIDFKIYHQQYTPESKKLHERIAQMEHKRDVKRIKRNIKARKDYKTSKS